MEVCLFLERFGSIRGTNKTATFPGYAVVMFNDTDLTLTTVPPDSGPSLLGRAPKDNTALFGSIDTWVFDLDNTLYPPHADLWPKVDAKITEYLYDFFGMDGLSARALQKYYYQRFGTTLNGLMLEHPDILDVAHFLDFVHDIDRSSIAIDDRLAAVIEQLPGRRLVFTNGSRGHAEKTMLALGIAHLFDDVFDIAAADLIPKPQAAPYDKFLALHGVNPEKAVMFEDIARNLEVPKRLGMGTVLVIPKLGGTDHRDAHDKTTLAPDHVDHVTDDLARFLEQIVSGLSQ